MNGEPRVVLFTRAWEPGGPEERAVAAAGCVPLEVPVLRFEPGRDLERLPARLGRPPALDFVVVTSRRAAEALAGALEGLPAGARPRCAAVGEASALPLRRAGVEVEVPVPEAGGGAGPLASHLLHRLDRGGRVLFVRGNLSLDILPGALRARGVEVEELEAYRTVPATPEVSRLLAALAARRVAAAVIGSPSAVEALRALLPAEAWAHLMELPVVAPGETTAEALLHAGARRVARAAEAGGAGIAAALSNVLAAGT